MIVLQPPPFRIYLLRHARSGWANPGESDFSRALDDTGYAEAEVVADRAMDKGYRPDIVICSTARRCRQTADAILRAFGSTCEINYVDALYNAPPDIYVELISAQKSVNSVMIIGHNPTIEDVLSGLVGENAIAEELPSGFPTAGLAVVESAADAAVARWQLADFLRP